MKTVQEPQKPRDKRLEVALKSHQTRGFLFRAGRSQPGVCQYFRHFAVKGFGDTHKAVHSKILFSPFNQPNIIAVTISHFRKTLL
jgi:hypothetical protein